MYYLLQIGFYNFVAKPMFEAMDILASMETQLSNLQVVGIGEQPFPITPILPPQPSLSHSTSSQPILILTTLPNPTPSPVSHLVARQPSHLTHATSSQQHTTPHQNHTTPKHATPHHTTRHTTPHHSTPLRTAPHHTTSTCPTPIPTSALPLSLTPPLFLVAVTVGRFLQERKVSAEHVCLIAASSEQPYSDHRVR